MEERVKVDVIVVGGGPAGLTAAYILSQGGLEVIVVERGEYAGSKNVSGLLYGSVIDEIIPTFFEKAPIERPVSRRSLTFLGDEEHCSIDFGTQRWNSPPYNNTFVVYRARFDRWYATQVEEAGASLLEATVVDELIYEGEGAFKKAVGIKVRGEEEFYADVILLADGANSLVTESAIDAMGLYPKKEQVYGLGVKEVIGLSSDRIEDRFHLEKGEGAALEFIGSPFEGLVGGGFIYTARESLSLGFLIKIDSLVKAKVTPDDVIQGFKNHPQIRGYLKGGELLEYSAHMIPEGGYRSVPRLTGNGIIIAGDAAGLVNASLYHEGSNLAMASGRCAAEAILRAKEKGDYSRKALSLYERGLTSSFVMEDLKRYEELPEIQEILPGLLSLYPRKVCNLLIDYYKNVQEPKRAIQKEAFKRFFKDLPKLRIARDILKMRKMI